VLTRQQPAALSDSAAKNYGHPMSNHRVKAKDSSKKNRMFLPAKLLISVSKHRVKRLRCHSRNSLDRTSGSSWVSGGTPIDCCGTARIWVGLFMIAMFAAD
jgi:hypothetical protein